MANQGEKLGSIQQDIPGKGCLFCGGNSYQLVLRSIRRFDDSILFVRCLRCRHPRRVDAEFKRALWITNTTTRIWVMLLTITESVRGPLQILQTYVDRRRNKQKTLQMLALSGAVRPSHVELRYTTPLLTVEGHIDLCQDTTVAPTTHTSLLTQFIASTRRFIMDVRSMRPYLDRHLASLGLELESRLRSLSVLPSTTTLAVAEGNGYLPIYERINHGTVESDPASHETSRQWVRGTIQGQMQQIREEGTSTIFAHVQQELRITMPLVVLPTVSEDSHEQPVHPPVLSKTVTVLRASRRNFASRFERKVLPLFTNQITEAGSLLPAPYVQELSTGNFDLALRNLLGKGTPLSERALKRLKIDFKQEYDLWMRRDLSNLSIVYCWAAGVYVKAGLEDHTHALLTIVGVLTTGEKIVLSCESGEPESKEHWLRLLRALEHRGLRFPRLTVAGGRLGLWAALEEIHPAGEIQGCWRRKIATVLKALPEKARPKARKLLKAIPCATTRTECERRRDHFVRTYGRTEQKAVDRLLRDWERMVTFYAFPQEHWRHIRTTNTVVSSFALTKIRTSASHQPTRVEGAKPIIWKMLRVAERSWGKLHAPELLPLVASSVSLPNRLMTQSKLPQIGMSHQSERSAA